MLIDSYRASGLLPEESAYRREAERLAFEEDPSKCPRCGMDLPEEASCCQECDWEI